ncbi:MAG: hypothetical protein K2Z25_06170 [Beijerinckiaceae bacterium]|nr:hypothetical protein [Beijerinckiaceae bacterium]
MALEIRLLVADAAPLITLAAARSLSYLLYPGIPVVIPDAVFHEATASSGKLGAEEIIDWYRMNVDHVRIEPTVAFQDATILASRAGRRLPRDLGERAALEIVRETSLLDGPADRALLLSDDRDVERLVVIDKERLILLTTGDFLRQLEAAQRIQSADHVLALVREAGRTPSERGLWDQHDPQIKDAVRSLLEQAGRDRPVER